MEVVLYMIVAIIVAPIIAVTTAVNTTFEPDIGDFIIIAVISVAAACIWPVTLAVFSFAMLIRLIYQRIEGR